MALRVKNKPKEKEEDKVIEINAQMEGSLSFKDPVNLKINGDFQGSLEARGTLTVGASAKVNAGIIGDNIVIAGKVQGDVTAGKMLVLMPTAVLEGNISTPKLNIVEGAVFQGQCRMMQASDLLSIYEVAELLELDIQEIEKLAESGEIPGIHNGEGWQFERAQIDQWASSLKAQ